jgi:hypothetical protein
MWKMEAFFKKKDTCKDFVYAAIVFVSVLVLYFVSVQYTNTRIDHRVHDFYTVSLPDEVELVVTFAANMIPIIVTIVYIMQMQGCRAVDIRRLALMYFLKGLIQFVTIVPGPAYIDGCVGKSFLEVMSAGICADMMFSGHTGIVFLLTGSYWRWLMVPLEAVLLVLGKQHYISDTIVSTIVCSWIELRVV